tara:strand:+ start:638 stop:1567 length:930 start_codon:yes stop_codon:yes gene_type:complete
MKQGTTTLIGLLSALLLAALAAATFYLKTGRDFQVKADQLQDALAENKELVTGLEKKVSGLETDYQEVLGLAREAEYEAAQLGDRLQEYDLDLQQLRGQLTVATNELQQARLVEQRLQQTLVKLNADKQKSEEETATLKSRVVELLKEKDEILKNNPGGIGNTKLLEYQKLGSSPAEIRNALAELKAFREQSATKPSQPVPPTPKPVTPSASPVTPPVAPLAPTTIQPPKGKTVTGLIKSIVPKFGSILLDVGMAQGVRIGDIFHVRRNGQIVGHLRTRALPNGFAICDIVPNTTTMPLMVGDQVELIR